MRSILKAALALAAVVCIGGSIVEGQGTETKGFEELKRQLESADPGVRKQALNYIGAMRPYPEELAPHVIRRLEDSARLPDDGNRVAAPKKGISPIFAAGCARRAILIRKLQEVNGDTWLSHSRVLLS